MKATDALGQIQQLIALTLEHKSSRGKKIARSIRFDEAMDTELNRMADATGADRTELVANCVRYGLAHVALELLSRREAERAELMKKLNPHLPAPIEPESKPSSRRGPKVSRNGR